MVHRQNDLLKLKNTRSKVKHGRSVLHFETAVLHPKQGSLNLCRESEYPQHAINSTNKNC